MDLSLPADLIRTLSSRLDSDDEARAAFPGETGARQPVHTVYGGAQLFQPDSAQRLGEAALRALEAHAPDPATLAVALGRPADDPIVAALYPRVVEKLRREPVEDYRIDFEDGFGIRPDAEEDAAAVTTADAVASGMAAGTLPPFIGIRIKQLSPELRSRALRTLDIFITRLVEQSGGRLPEHFHVTLPKVISVDQAAVFGDALDALESALGLPAGSIGAELMIEITRSIFDEEGRVNVARLVRATGPRCIAAHFGTYDYTASCQITAAYQGMTHPSCDFARHVMQVSLAGTGVWLSDGATNVLPVAIHRGDRLTATQLQENRTAVHEAWRQHFDEIRHSLVHGFYQGWDLHPAQLVTRYAAVQAFFLESLDAGAARLANFVEKATQATLVGDVFDDAATGQGLLNFFARAINSGAISEEEAAVRTGVTLEELRGRSFLQILANRRGR
ncbi:MAG TPA: phosphoenolpyruvate kinase [Actinobacteria bacterium]|nr:phosphoenolpyruvate kinase [Actinomycetota bacterium]